MGGSGGTGRVMLRIAGAACLVAGLFPHYSQTPASPPPGGRTDLRLGLPFSPAFEWHRTTVESHGTTLTLEDGRQLTASSFSSTSWGFSVHVLSWSAALVLAGVVLLILSLRSRAPSGREP